MTVEVWIGTPNEMAKAAEKDTQSAAITWARGHLASLEKQAKKFDNAGWDHIVHVREELIKCPVITIGDTRAWQFPYMGIQFRIELRRPM